MYIPIEIKDAIMEYIYIPKFKNKKEIIIHGNILRELALIDKEFNKLINPRLIKLKELTGICNKYHRYNDISFYDSNKKMYVKYEDNGYLYDAVLTGCDLPFALHSVNIYDSVIENDIKLLLQYMPNTLNFNYGYLKCRSNVTPLAAACINENIPINIIELFLKYGTSLDSTIDVNGYPIEIIKDIAYSPNIERYGKILDLYKNIDKIKQ